MSQKELQRSKVIENAVEGRLKIGEAAELLQAERAAGKAAEGAVRCI